MTRKPEPLKPVVYGYQDLCRVTGKSRQTVCAAIRRGELPGYVVGRSYVVPAEAFHAFCRGEWQQTSYQPEHFAPVLVTRKAS
jgi:excisionase family DNA binding protein